MGQEDAGRAGDRSRLLCEKIAANNQRRQREGLLRRLPPHLSEVLSTAPCVYALDIDPVLRRFLPIKPEGVGLPPTSPPGYAFTEVGWEHKALALAAQAAPPPASGRAYLLLGQPTSLPLFLVDFRWAFPLLGDLWDVCRATRVLALVEERLLAGTVIDSYCGYLPEDLGPAEVVYEVARWPVGGA